MSDLPQLAAEKGVGDECQECGMWVEPVTAYHPYAACLMFKACRNGTTVTANLDAVIAFGAQHFGVKQPAEPRGSLLEFGIYHVELNKGPGTHDYQVWDGSVGEPSQADVDRFAAYFNGNTISPRPTSTKGAVHE